MQTDTMEITILGCGLATGIPNVEFGWGSTDSNNPKNRRSRTSVYIKHPRASLLVDTGVDISSQCFNNGINEVDAILYTHNHADHTHGIDFVRSFNRLQNKVIPCYFEQGTSGGIEEAFPYVFSKINEEIFKESGYMKPCLEANYIQHYKSFFINGIEVIAGLQHHGYVDSTGFRIGDFVYATDVSALPSRTMDLYRGADTIILGVLGKKPHNAHFCLDQGIEVIRELKPRMAYFTHLGGSIDYNQVSEILPENIRLCYDGLKIKVPIKTS